MFVKFHFCAKKCCDNFADTFSFSDVKISQGSVATRLRRGSIYSFHFIAFLESLTVKEF